MNKDYVKPQSPLEAQVERATRMSELQSYGNGNFWLIFWTLVGGVLLLLQVVCLIGLLLK